MGSFAEHPLYMLIGALGGGDRGRGRIRHQRPAGGRVRARYFLDHSNVRQNAFAGPAEFSWTQRPKEARIAHRLDDIQ